MGTKAGTADRITGTRILLFVLPLTVPVVALKYIAPFVCTAATFAAIQEGKHIRTGRNDT